MFTIFNRRLWEKNISCIVTYSAQFAHDKIAECAFKCIINASRRVIKSYILFYVRGSFLRIRARKKKKSVVAIMTEIVGNGTKGQNDCGLR